jgi:virulence factor Mce-like protein
MRRLAATAVTLAAAAAAVFVLGGAGGEGGGSHYTVELDNAFGLVSGSDVKVAGVRAGSITSVKLDLGTKHALVGIRIEAQGFGSLRSDVRCTVRPQSLLGEYYLDCLPGRSPHVLADGASIPVTHTASTIAPDLVLGVMRMPYRERFRLIIGELGAGVAGNGQELNAALRRAVPAIGQTDNLLRTLGAQRRQLADLATNADAVIGKLAANRRDVGRFVDKARNTAAATAARSQDLSAGLAHLPGFLAQVTPAMRSLQVIADRGTPSLENLNASAGQLHELLANGASVSSAALPAVRSLGDTSTTGIPAMRISGPAGTQLASFTSGTPELARNLRIILRHLDDRKAAVQRHPLSPGGQGFTALENVMRYIYNQVLSINLFDGESHLLGAGVFVNQCSPYTEPAQLKQNPQLMGCRSWLGPNQPGINQPDATDRGDGGAAASKRAHRARRARPGTRRSTPEVPGLGSPGAPTTPLPPGAPPAVPAPVPLPAPASVSHVLDYLLGP